MSNYYGGYDDLPEFTDEEVKNWGKPHTIPTYDLEEEARWNPNITKGKKFKYYERDEDGWIYAIDEDGVHYKYSTATGKLEQMKGYFNCMYGGIDEDDAKERMKTLLDLKRKQAKELGIKWY